MEEFTPGDLAVVIVANMEQVWTRTNRQTHRTSNHSRHTFGDVSVALWGVGEGLAGTEAILLS